MSLMEAGSVQASTHQGRVLVVEDELDQQELLRFNLRRAGYVVSATDDGHEALRLAVDEPPDAVVLDVMLPGMDGVEVCRRLRAQPQTAHIPVLMLTAKTEDSDMVAGLDAGADDYITKPYSPSVLLARVKAVLRQTQRRTTAAVESGEATIRHQDLVIRPDRFEVTLAEKPIRLSGTEFRMLALLASRPGYVFSREQIIRSVHGGDCAVTNRSVDVHIFWLRQKLGPRGRLIEAVRGVGYRFRDPGH